MSKIKLNINGYILTYERSDFFCPGCGQKNIYEEIEQPSEHMQFSWLCLSCERSFNIEEFEKSNKSRIVEIKKLIQK